MAARIPYQSELENNFRIAYLIGNFIRENLSDDEVRELERWIMVSDRNMRLFEDLTAEETTSEFLQWYEARDTEARLAEVKKRIRFRRATTMRTSLKVAASVVVLLGVGTAVYMASDQEPKDLELSDVPMTNDLNPGISRAVLKMPDGNAVEMIEGRDTVLSRQVRITGDDLQFNAASDRPEMHTVSTPMKSYYKFHLPDGSEVWLNAGSSIRFPSVFQGTNREVEVTGETYFKVAHDAVHPFIVRVNGIAVKALGTAFNINAYADEPGLRITLAEGSVEVTAEQHTRLLKPGQQLEIGGTGWSTSEMPASDVIAWTRNEFRVKRASIQEVMRMAARWYDARIVFEDPVKDHFSGTIDRNIKASGFLKILEATGEVNFRIRGDTIVVTR